MRLAIAVLCSLLLAACSEVSDNCPKIWQVEKSQLAAYANVEGGRLSFEVRNTEGPNAVRLEQTGLVGDFQLNLELLSLEGDSISTPQFRLEVFELTSPSEVYSGIAVQPSIYYCYVGNSQPENRDNRLAHFDEAVLRITRLNGILTCDAVVNGIALTVADTFHTEPLGVRLVFGTTSSTSGVAMCSADNFQVTAESDIISDAFNCRSW